MNFKHIDKEYGTQVIEFTEDNKSTCVALIENHMPKHLKPHIDSEDIVEAFYNSLKNPADSKLEINLFLRGIYETCDCILKNRGRIILNE